MYTFGLTPLIDEPSRVTSTSSSIIDLICVSHTDNVLQSGVLPFGLSDHCITYCTRKVPKQFFGTHNTVKVRSLKNYTCEKFINELRKIDWFQVLNCENVDTAWQNFKVLFVHVIDVVAPVKQVRTKQSSELWFSSDIIDSISKRDIAFRLYRKHRDEQHRVEYNKLRNIVQRKIKTAKKEFVRGTIEDNKHSIKKLWKALKGLGMGAKTKAQNVNIGLLDEKNEICFEKSFVANKFNTFFCEVASKLVELLPPYQAINKVDLRNFYSKCNVKDNMFKFSVVSEEEICKLLSAINPCKATGQDGISTKFIRDSAQVITEPITYIINLSLAQSKVPNEFKTARVIPLYKKGEKCKE